VDEGRGYNNVEKKNRATTRGKAILGGKTCGGTGGKGGTESGGPRHGLVIRSSTSFQTEKKGLKSPWFDERNPHLSPKQKKEERKRKKASRRLKR